MKYYINTDAFGAYIRELRERDGLLSSYLARRFLMTPDRLNQLESGIPLKISLSQIHAMQREYEGSIPVDLLDDYSGEARKNLRRPPLNQPEVVKLMEISIQQFLSLISDLGYIVLTKAQYADIANRITKLEKAREIERKSIFLEQTKL